LKRFAILMALGLMAVAALATGAACSAGSGPMLSGVAASPQTITPNGDGSGDIAEIIYRVSRPVSVSIYFMDAAGARYDFRVGEPRPAGDYVAQFNGVIQSPVSLAPGFVMNQARLLPNGSYRFVVQAVDSQGAREETSGNLAIADRDLTAPEIMDFSVFTPSYNREPPPGSAAKIIFTPNRDGISDRIAVSFRLTKPAWSEVYLVRLGDANRTRYPIGERQWYKLPGTKNFDYEGGVDLGNTPPPNGDYLCIAEATDLIGNHTVVAQPITVADGGVPLAEIVSAKFAPLVVPLGGLLRVEIVVENIGPVTIRSKGPYSGTIYANTENLNAKSVSEGADFYEEPGVFRVGVDYEGNSEGREYPYRWGFEGDVLRPGERATVVGYIRIVSPVRPYNPNFWVGLLHEQVRKVNDKYKPTRITIGF
jgi:hypothetical protein